MRDNLREGNGRQLCVYKHEENFEIIHGHKMRVKGGTRLEKRYWGGTECCCFQCTLGEMLHCWINLVWTTLVYIDKLRRIIGHWTTTFWVFYLLGVPCYPLLLFSFDILQNIHIISNVYYNFVVYGSTLLIKLNNLY